MTSVSAEVRYLNDEWRDRADLPEIGSRESRRANTTKHAVHIEDARELLRSGAIEIDRNGFTVAALRSEVADFHDTQSVTATYYDEIRALLTRLVGADAVYITQHVLRTESVEDFNKAYARFIHCDYSVRDPRAAAHKLLQGRDALMDDFDDWEFAWFNTWQPVDREVQQNPLALIDASTVADGDLAEYVYTGFGKRDGSSGMPVFSPKHRFYYVPRMQTDEVLVFKQLETRPERSLTCPHTSFDDATAAPDALGRRSIEVRAMCAFAPPGSA